MEKEKRPGSGQMKILIVGTVALVILAGLCYAAAPYVGKLVSQAELIRRWVEQHRMAGRIIYVAVVIFQVILALIPGEPLEIVGGYAFGAVEGTLLCLFGAVVGSLIVFCLVRRFGEGLVRVFFSGEKLRSLRFLQDSPKRIFLFWIVYLIPGTPKDLLCYYAGLTDIKLSVFIMICSIGRIPSLVTSTVGGDALGMESYQFAVIVFAVTLLISGAGLMIYNWICKKHEKKR